MRRVIVALAAIAAVSLAGAAKAEPLKIVSQETPALPGLKAFVLHSERIGRDFQVVAHLPSATAFLPGQKFPVIYALDSGYGLAGQTGVLLGNTGAMAPAIIVDVGYTTGQG